LPGYHPLIFKLRHNNVQGGGVGIYLKNCFNYSLLPEFSLFVDRVLETIFIEVYTSNNTKLTIGSLYRPGSTHPILSVSEQFSQFFDLLSNLCSELLTNNRTVYLLGDLNIDVLKYGVDVNATEYVDLLFSFGLLQLVVNPTRCTPTSASLIDHVITNNKVNMCDTVIMISKISDHFPVVHFKKDFIRKKCPKTFESRSFSQPNMNLFREALRNNNWDLVTNSDSAQIAFNFFSDTFFSLYDIYFPLRSVKFNKNYHSIENWMSPGLLISRREKIRLFKLSAKVPSPRNIATFKNYRNIYNKLTKLAKKLYYEKQFLKFQSNLKKTWQLIYEVIKKSNSKNDPIQHIIVNNVSISDPRIMAESFNEFFSNVAVKIVNEIVPTDRPPDKIELNENSPLFSFSDDPLTSGEIIECFKSIQKKKTPDANGLSVDFISNFAMTLSNPLKHIFSLSFNTGIVPTQLKVAKVIPVFKGGDKSQMDNYRPISLLNTFSKVMEKIVHNRLSSFLNENNLLSESQYGFRKEHSTIHPLTKFLNFITKAFNDKEHCIAIFCDLRKAFDTVDHKILLTKLYNLGIQGTELKWFENYLTGRKQFVVINGKASTLREIILGVPQGSILGPLLFIIYINDLAKASRFFSSLFADDTKLLAKNSDPVALNNFVNTEFHKISTFFRAHRLSLHVTKTKFMVFSNSNAINNFNFNVVINNNNNVLDNNVNLIFPIERVHSNSEIPAIKFLGVFMDPNLNFKFHIQKIAKKISAGLYFIRSARNFLSQKSLKCLYYSLIHCHLIYAIHIFSCTSPSNLKGLITLQKSAVRLITLSSYNAHTEPLFKSQRILPFNDLVLFFKLQFMQQFKQGFLPKSFSGEWLTYASRLQDPNQDLMELRNVNFDNFIIPFARLAITERFPLTSFAKAWNEFDDFEIKSIHNKLDFNNKLKQFLLDKLNANISCNRLLCPHCHL
jgi:Reverse transcriptase (RNA-dependent DNA polymerase)